MSAQQLREDGAKLFTEGDFEGSLAKFSGALAVINSASAAEQKELQATQLSCLLNSASCCIKLNKHPETVEYATAALGIDKKSAKAMYRRGQARRQLKEFSKARIDLVMALEIKDDDEAIREELKLLRQDQDKAGPAASKPPGDPFGAKPLFPGQGGAGANPFAAMEGFGGAPPQKKAVAAAPVSFNAASLSGAAKELYDAAEGGDASSQIKLAEAFEEGKSGFPKSPSHGFTYYKKAADQNNAEGQNCLGWCYKVGFGTPASATAAYEVYVKCAENGHVKGQANLGFCFEKGDGVAQDLAKAAHWYEKSAEQGHSVAQVNLALMYEKGNGVEKDAAKALEWYRKAGAQGNPNANINIGLCYEKGIVVEKNMAEAFKFYLQAAEKGDHTGQTIIGCCYETGEGVAVNRDLALDFYMKAAQQGNGHAKEGLKRMTGAGGGGGGGRF